MRQLTVDSKYLVRLRKEKKMETKYLTLLVGSAEMFKTGSGFDGDLREFPSNVDEKIEPLLYNRYRNEIPSQDELLLNAFMIRDIVDRYHFLPEEGSVLIDGSVPMWMTPYLEFVLEDRVFYSMKNPSGKHIGLIQGGHANAQAMYIG